MKFYTVCMVTKSTRQRLTAPITILSTPHQWWMLHQQSVINENTQINFKGSTCQESILIKRQSSNEGVMVGLAIMISVTNHEKAAERLLNCLRKKTNLEFQTRSDIFLLLTDVTWFYISDLVLHKRYIQERRNPRCSDSVRHSRNWCHWSHLWDGGGEFSLHKCLFHLNDDLRFCHPSQLIQVYTTVYNNVVTDSIKYKQINPEDKW